ncbi:MAG: allantoinase AllB [Bacillota bacterium]|jgi:allantoinase
MSANSYTRVDTLIRKGTVVTEKGSFSGTIAIKNGLIVGILSPDTFIEADEVLDVPGCLVLPGLIDPHLHLFEPGAEAYREGFYFGTQAAASGGVTTIIEMPLSFPPVLDQESFNLKLKIAQSKVVVDFALWGGLIPASLKNINELKELGCIGFKAFMTNVEEFYPITTDYHLIEAMKQVAEFDGLIAVHAENDDIVAYYTKLLKDSGRLDSEVHSDSRPEFAELEAIKRAILFAEHTNCRLHVCHLSTASGAEAIRQAKQRGVRVTTETCHHYLTFDRSELSRRGNFAKCNPPLRDKENVEKLWQFVLKGNVDCISSDHGPYSDEDKQRDSGSIWDAPAGFGGIDVMLSLIYEEGVHKRGLSLEKLVALTSTNTAKIFGLYPWKGSMLIGADADIAILDPNKIWVYRGVDSLSQTKSVNTPFEGRKMKGKVIATIVRGQTVYREGKILVEPGIGKYIPNNYYGMDGAIKDKKAL